MKREEIFFIRDILSSIEYIQKFSKGLTKEKFMKDKLKQSAIIRHFEIIGEAVKNISIQTREKYPEIEWKKIAGSRDIFIHGYFMVDYEAVWEIIQNKLSILKIDVQKVKDYFDSKNKTHIKNGNK